MGAHQDQAAAQIICPVLLLKIVHGLVLPEDNSLWRPLVLIPLLTTKEVSTGELQ